MSSGEAIARPGASSERVTGALLLGLAAFAYRGLLAYPDLPQFRYTAGFWLLQPGSTWPALGVAGAFWLLMRRRDRLAALPGTSAPALAAPLLLIAAGSLVWGNLHGTAAPLVLSLASGALGAAALRHGAAGCRVILLPVAFLVFAVPPPPPLINEVVWTLQLWTAQLSGWLVAATGTPAVVETLVLSRPDHDFIVVESCTGWRVIEILTSVAVLMREACLGAGLRSWLPVILAPVVAVALNVARIAVIVATPDPDLVGDHALQAVALVGVGSAILAAVALSVRRRSAPRPGAGLSGSALLAAAGGVTLSAILLSLFPFRDAPEAANPRLRMPLEHAGWTAERSTPDRAFLGTVRFDAAFQGEYARRGEKVVAFVGVERGAVPRSSGRSPKTLLPGLGWHIVEQQTGFLELVGRPADAGILTDGDGSYALALHWRTADGGLAGESLEHLLGLPRAPRAVIRLTTPLESRSEEDEAAAAASLLRFAEDFREPLSHVTTAPPAPVQTR